MRQNKAIVSLIMLIAAVVMATFAATGKEEAGASLRMELFTGDLDKSVSFYTTVLGFAVERREKDYAVMKRGTVELGLGIAGDLPPKHYFKPELMTQRRGLGVEIVIEVDDIEAELQHVTSASWPLLSELKKRPWGPRDFRLADPDGYYFRLTER